jgi:GNAT superfamily N-acetyltransferase
MTNVRKGEERDLSDVLALIKELAKYEKSENEVETTLDSMKIDFLAANKLFDFLVAEEGGIIVGTAIYFYTYSTWKGKTLYLEDIVVKESKRRHGIGSILFNELVQIAKIEKVKRMSWQVLDWNEPAILFYRKINANFD